MLSTKFGIEIEFTGITREWAARVAAEFLQGTYSEGGTYYDTKKVKTPDGRVWRFMYDGSIHCQRKEGRRKQSCLRYAGLFFVVSEGICKDTFHMHYFICSSRKWKIF